MKVISASPAGAAPDVSAIYPLLQPGAAALKSMAGESRRSSLFLRMLRIARTPHLAPVPYAWVTCTAPSGLQRLVTRWNVLQPVTCSLILFALHSGEGRMGDISSKKRARSNGVTERRGAALLIRARRAIDTVTGY